MFVLTFIYYSAAIFILVYIFQYIKKRIGILITLHKVSGPPSDNLTSTGNIKSLADTPEAVFRTLRKWNSLFYPIYKVYLLNIITVCVMSPEDFALILSNSQQNTKSPIYFLLRNWLKTGLLTSGGEKWLKRRKILTPAFHFRILQDFILVFNEETEKLVENLRNDCHKPSLDVVPYVDQFTLKTIIETSMGTKLESDNLEQNTYKTAIREIGKLLLYKLARPWFKLIPNFIYFNLTETGRKEREITDILLNFTKKVINEKRKNFQNIKQLVNQDVTYSKRKRLAMLDLLLLAESEDKSIDDEGIREEVDTFMFEGHDTTAMALSFALMLIAGNRNVQDQIFQEVQAILGTNNPRKPTYTDLQEMSYLERCIKEVLRLYPSVHFISRMLGEEVITNSGYTLPKGTIVNLFIYDVHHNPETYPDPEKFDPDRFLPENSIDRHPFAYVPFSAGPRNCIGQKFAMLELKAALSGIISNFVLEPIDRPSDVELLADIVLRPKDGIRVKFIPRDKLIK